MTNSTLMAQVSHDIIDPRQKSTYEYPERRECRTAHWQTISANCWAQSALSHYRLYAVYYYCRVEDYRYEENGSVCASVLHESGVQKFILYLEFKSLEFKSESSNVLGSNVPESRIYGICVKKWLYTYVWISFIEIILILSN